VKAKEAALRQDLSTVRDVLDHTKQTGESISVSVGTGERRVLRGIPKDPFTGATTTWQEISDPVEGVSSTSFQGPSLWGRTVLRIIIGNMPINHRHRSCFQASVEAAAPISGGASAALSVLSLGSPCLRCGELEPMREPEVVDLELTHRHVKASVRDGNGMLLSAADLEVRRRELAEAQIARAQLEGRVRETERRIIEAREVIELQRKTGCSSDGAGHMCTKTSLHYRTDEADQKPLSGRGNHALFIRAGRVPYIQRCDTQGPKGRGQFRTTKSIPQNLGGPRSVAPSAAVMPVPVSHKSSSDVEQQRLH